jgi:hypothetical protein
VKVEQSFREELEALAGATGRAGQAQQALNEATAEIENRRGALRLLEKLYPDTAKKVRQDAVKEQLQALDGEPPAPEPVDGAGG